MKFNYKILITSCWLVLLFSCIKDKGNYDYADLKDLFTVQINGLPTDTTAIILQEFSLSPIISGLDENKEYEYTWLLYTSQIGDTLSRSIKLENVLLSYPQNDYNLTFYVREKERDIVYFYDINLSLVSVYNDGFFVVKDINDETDIDFIDNSGEVISDLIYKANGFKIKGKGHRFIYQSGGYYHREQNEDGILEHTVRNGTALHVFSDKEAISLDENSMTYYKMNGDMLLEPMEEYGYGNYEYPFGMYSIFMLNRKFFRTSMGAANTISVYGRPLKLSISTPDGTINSDDYYLANEWLLSLYGNTLCYDIKSGLFTFNDMGNDNYIVACTQEKLLLLPELGYKFKDLLPRSVPNGYAIMFHDDFENIEWTPEVDEDGNEEEQWFSEAMILSVSATANPLVNHYPLSIKAQLLEASIMEAHKTGSYIYFALDNKIYSHYITDNEEELDSREVLEFTFPEGETISYISHNSSFNELFVLTNSTSGWTFYRFTMIGATKNFDKTPVKTYRGSGNARFVNYKG